MAKIRGAFLLILAVALILFGVTFINNAFKSIREKTGKAIEVTENVLMPTIEDPLKLEQRTKNINMGGKADLTISFMNPTEKEKYCQLSVYDSTAEGVLLMPDEGSWIIYNHAPTSKIKPEQISVWRMAMGDKEEIKQTKLLTINVCCQDSDPGEFDVSCSADIDNGVEFRKDFVLNIG